MGFPGGSDGKEPACNAGDLSSTPGSRRPPTGGAMYSSILAWRIPGIEEPGGLQSLGVTKGSEKTERLTHNTHTHTHTHQFIIKI